MILSLNGIIAGRGITPSTLLTNLRNVYKAESNANDSYGTVNGTAQGGLTYTSGKSGNAFNFNGTNAYVSYPDNSFNLAGPYSISFWVYFATDPSGITPYFLNSFNDSAGTGFELRCRIGKPEMNLFTTGGLFTCWYTSNITINNSGWYHIVLTKALNQQPQFYYNGVSTLTGIRVSNATVTEISYTNPVKCSIGNNINYLSNYMPSGSKLDEFNIWNKELTATEVTELYNSGVGKFYPFTTSNLDSDAGAFITAASITDTTQQSAINQLVTDLKSANIWTKMKAIYPFVGGTASSHRFNLKDPRPVSGAFYLDFFGGVTHSSNGVHFDGATGYADTKLNASANMNQNSTHLSYYSRTNNAAGGSGEIGALTTSPTQYSHMHIYYTGGSYTDKFLPIINTTIVNSSTDMTNSLGHYVGNRASNTIIVGYKNGVVVMNANTNPSTTLPNLNYYIGALNINGTASNYSARNCAFATIGDGITDADATAFYNAVQNFNTTLNRQV